MFEFTICGDLIDDSLHKGIDFTVLGVIRRSNEIHSAIFYKFLCLSFGSMGTWLVDGDRMTTLIFDHSKTGDIRFPITDEHHISKRYGTVFLWDKLIDLVIVVYIQNTLVDAE